MFQISDCLSEVSDMNLKDICRLCRTAKGVMSYIYGNPGVDTSVPLSIRIMKFANIKVIITDSLPVDKPTQRLGLHLTSDISTYVYLFKMVPISFLNVTI
jgi:hypothetical protein